MSSLAWIMLHPAEEPLHGAGRLVRWAEVAAWSGVPLRPGSQFHSIALPRVRPEGEAPWTSQGPRQGSLYPPDAVILAGILRDWTTTPQRCWFCVWDGYGWDDRVSLTASDRAAAAEPDSGLRPDLVPADVRGGSRVQLPNRDYLLHSGPVEAALATVGPGGQHQAANLWWPQDRAWFVATEIDLAWTYVGGPAGLIGQLLAGTRLPRHAASLAETPRPAQVRHAARPDDPRQRRQRVKLDAAGPATRAGSARGDQPSPGL